MESRKYISFLVMLAFGWLVMFQPLPALADKAGGTGSDSSVNATPGTGDESGALEKEKAGASVGIKKKPFPWLWVAAGTVVAGLLVYFLVLKKPSFTLTVAIGSGASGTPEGGAYSYKKNTEISYSFALQVGYKDLKVTLDGVEVAAGGTVKMDRKHFLKASATPIKNTLTVTVSAGVSGTPTAGVYSYSLNESVDFSYSLEENYENLMVMLDGAEVAAAGTILMDKSHTLDVTAWKNILGYWTITLVPQSGGPVTGQINFVDYGGGSSSDKRIFWDVPLPFGSGFGGFWSVAGTVVSFGGPYQIQYRGYTSCQGNRSGENAMSGSYTAWDPGADGGGGSPTLIGSGTWSAWR